MKFYDSPKEKVPLGKKWVSVRVYQKDGNDVPMWGLADKYPVTSPTRNLCFLAEYAELSNYNKEIVKNILKKTHKINRIFKYNDEKTTILNEAIKQENYEMSQILLKRGANPNIDVGEWRECAIDMLAFYPDDRSDDLYRTALDTFKLALQKGGNLNLILQLDGDPSVASSSIFIEMWAKWSMFSLVAYDKYEFGRDFMNRAIVYGYQYGFGADDLFEPIPEDRVNECFITETDKGYNVIIDKDGHIYGRINPDVKIEELGTPIIDLFEYHY